MAFKNDIQATRFTAASTVAVIAQPVRLRGLIVSSSGGGTGRVTLTTTTKLGDTLLDLDIPPGDVVNFSFPEDGILFPKGVFCSTLTSVASVVVLTDKYSGPNLTSDNSSG
jgi:hypothetical protein